MTTIRALSPSRWLVYLLRSLISLSCSVISAISASGSQHRPTEYTLAQRVVSRIFAERYEGSTRSAGYAYCIEIRVNSHPRHLTLRGLDTVGCSWRMSMRRGRGRTNKERIQLHARSSEDRGFSHQLQYSVCIHRQGFELLLSVRAYIRYGRH